MKQSLRTCLLLAGSCCLAAMLGGCSSELEDDFETTRSSDGSPALTTPTVVVNSTSITLTSQITGIDDYTVRNYGFVYSAEDSLPGYTVSKTNFRKRVTTRDSLDFFTGELTSLTLRTLYYARAYAITIDADNVNDTIFSQTVTFTLPKVLPEIELMPITNRAKRGACAFAKFTTPGNVDLVKFGISYSTSQYPTISDDGETANDTCTYEGYEGEFGAFFQVLEPKTLYYVRAWAITEEDTVYSNQRMFRTTEGGRYSWAWASNYSGAVSDGAADRISEAMDSAAYYYNNYSNLYLSASVEYNTGVTTADCSYGGWIRFGATERYQWVGTAQHETSHGLGVGTASNWSTLLVSSVWTGECGQRTCRAIMHDQTQTLKGDSQHMWPGGINQREEVTDGTTNSYNETIKDERMLRGNAMICNALQVDGLACP